MISQTFQKGNILMGPNAVSYHYQKERKNLVIKREQDLIVNKQVATDKPKPKSDITNMTIRVTQNCLYEMFNLVYKSKKINISMMSNWPNNY